MRDKSRIQSLERGLRILELFGEAARPLSLSEVAQEAGLNKTTAQRFLNTLCGLGYVKRLGNRKFLWGSRILTLGYRYLNNSGLVQAARPFMDDFSREAGRTVNLAVLEGQEIVFLYRREVKRFLKYDLHPGSRLPAYCTASGKVLLAALDNKRLEELLQQMELRRVTPRTLVSRDLLWKDLMETRERGYSICDRELSMDLVSLGAPVMGGEGTVVAAINVSLDPTERNGSGIKAAAMALISVGEAISHALGYLGPYPRLHSQQLSASARARGSE